MIRPTIRQLSYLIAIDEYGSFVAAADHCAVTQSTLSSGIKELESILEQKVVNRGRKETILTPFGVEVLKTAKAIIDDADKIITRAQLLKEPLSGPLRLGVIPTIAPYMLPDLLPKIRRKFPNLELQIIEDMTDNLLERLDKRKIDVILMAFPYDTPNKARYNLFEEKFFLVASTNQSFDVREMKVEDLNSEELLLLEDGHCMRRHALDACNLQDTKHRKVFSTTSLPTIIQMVRHGFGMTLLPEMACKTSGLESGMRIIPFSGSSSPTRQIGLCWRDNDLRKADYEMLAQSI
ncbi:MAG: hydrogen peroxide-inducible genes activator [Bdellovibrionales bacterium]